LTIASDCHPQQKVVVKVPATDSRMTSIDIPGIMSQVVEMNQSKNFQIIHDNISRLDSQLRELSKRIDDLRP
jgi:hypothetical protein